MEFKFLQSKLKTLKDSYDVKANEYLNEETSIERKEVLDNEMQVLLDKIKILKNEIEIIENEIEIESKKAEIIELENTLETESNTIMKQITRFKIKILQVNIRRYKFPNDPSLSKLIIYYCDEIKKLEQSLIPLPPAQHIGETILETEFVRFNTSKYSASEGQSFEGIGWNYQIPLFHDMIRDSNEENNICSRIMTNHPVDQHAFNKLVYFLRRSLHLNFEWKKYSETERIDQNEDVTIQSHHLNMIASYYQDNFLTTGEYIEIHDCPECLQTTNTLNYFGLNDGPATDNSTPDGYLVDTKGIIRGIVEVKSSEEAPIQSLRQASASAINIACYLVDHGVPPLDVLVPTISSNGNLFQFGAVMVLPPCFPYFFALSKVLDLTDNDDHLQIASYIYRIMEFIKVPYQYHSNKCTIERGISETRFYIKNLEKVFQSQMTMSQSLLYIFQALRKAYIREESRKYIVFPICIRNGNKNEPSSLVFQNVTTIGFKIGVPQDSNLHECYKNELRTALNEIHESGIVHMDVYPSNIMWKEENGGIQIKLIDWDAVQIIGEPYSYHVRARLSLDNPSKFVTGELDHKHVDLICSNIAQLAQIDQTKEKLDTLFHNIYYGNFRSSRTSQPPNYLIHTMENLHLTNNNNQTNITETKIPSNK